MMDMLLAIMFVCSLSGECAVFHDASGPSGSVQACRVRLDNMAARIRKDSTAVTAAIGEFDPDQVFRGLCVNPDPSKQGADVNKYDISIH